MNQYARARTWLASAKDDWLLPLTKSATEELLAEHDALFSALEHLIVEADDMAKNSDIYLDSFGEAMNAARAALHGEKP